MASEIIARSAIYKKPGGVCFDPETISLQGLYGNELALYRARKQWKITLEEAFMLELEKDFSFTLLKNYEQMQFILFCHFHTACGRYAFWRLTNYQAPEAQYEIETAHVPFSAQCSDALIAVPDLLPIDESPLMLEPPKYMQKSMQNRNSQNNYRQGFKKLVFSVLSKILNRKKLL